ncbi:MAG: hypothetical protein ABI851_12130 [Saprospiraceae bacterium]
MAFITRSRILELIKEAVAFSPASMTYKRPNTFALINGLSDFNADNLGYITEDIQNNDVWTRKQSTLNRFILEYPIVCPMLFSGVQERDIINNSTVIQKDDVRILCADLYVDQKEGTTASQRRSKTQIYDDTEEVLNNIIEYIRHVVYAKIEITTGVYTEGFYNESYLTWLDTNNKIIGFDPSQLFQFEQFKRENEVIQIQRIEYPSSKDLIIGTYMNLKTTTISCPNPEFTFSGDFSTAVLKSIIPFGR